MGKTNPLKESDLSDFVENFNSKELNKNSWTVDTKEISSKSYDLSVLNPTIIE